MKIDLENIENSFYQLMKYLTNCELFQEGCTSSKEIDLAYDFYWSVPIGHRFNIHETIENDIGSIDHDVERIKQCLLDNEPNTQHFRYLGNIMIAIADTLEANGVLL